MLNTPFRRRAAHGTRRRPASPTQTKISPRRVSTFVALEMFGARATTLAYDKRILSNLGYWCTPATSVETTGSTTDESLVCWMPRPDKMMSAGVTDWASLLRSDVVAPRRESEAEARSRSSAPQEPQARASVSAQWPFGACQRNATHCRLVLCERRARVVGLQAVGLHCSVSPG